MLPGLDLQNLLYIQPGIEPLPAIPDRSLTTHLPGRCYFTRSTPPYLISLFKFNCPPLPTPVAEEERPERLYIFCDSNTDPDALALREMGVIVYDANWILECMKKRMTLPIVDWVLTFNDGLTTPVRQSFTVKTEQGWSDTLSSTTTLVDRPTLQSSPTALRTHSHILKRDPVTFSPKISLPDSGHGLDARAVTSNSKPPREKGTKRKQAKYRTFMPKGALQLSLAAEDDEEEEQGERGGRDMEGYETEVDDRPPPKRPQSVTSLVLGSSFSTTASEQIARWQSQKNEISCARSDSNSSRSEEYKAYSHKIGCILGSEMSSDEDEKGDNADGGVPTFLYSDVLRELETQDKRRREERSGLRRSARLRQRTSNRRGKDMQEEV